LAIDASGSMAQSGFDEDDKYITKHFDFRLNIENIVPMLSLVFAHGLQCKLLSILV